MLQHSQVDLGGGQQGARWLLAALGQAFMCKPGAFNAANSGLFIAIQRVGHGGNG